MKKYEGKEPCPGCGRTGEEVARDGKNVLCYDCAQSLLIGKALVKERNLDRKWYRLDDMIEAEMTWYTIPLNDISKAVCELLRTFSQFDVRNVSRRGSSMDCQLAGTPSAITSRDRFILPAVTFEAAKKLCGMLKDACWQLKREQDNYRRELDKQNDEYMKAEKNRIYNEGVAYGRNLLTQLNNGEIGVNEFEKFVEKYN